MEGSYHGYDGVRRWWEDQFDVWPDLTLQVVEVRDVDDLTVAAVHLRCHGAGSDIPLDETSWQVNRWRRGKCVWWRGFDTRAEALEAVGLSEQAMSQENVEMVRRAIDWVNRGDFRLAMKEAPTISSWIGRTRSVL